VPSPARERASWAADLNRERASDRATDELCACGQAHRARTTAQSTATRKIDHAIVAFEADELDAANCSGWSVIMTGRAEVVKDAEMITRYRAVPLVPRAPGVRDQYVTITTELIEGLRGTRRHWDRACPGLTPAQLPAYTRGGRFVRDTIGSPIQDR
jgi:hypothetical protein